MRHVLKTTAAAAVLAAGLGGSAAAQEKISIGELSWDGALAIAHVMKAVIETRLGGEAEIKKAESTVIMAGMDKGDGGLDVYTDLWMPNQKEKWEDFIEKRKTVDHNNTPYKGTQALFIPSYITEKHGVKTIEDLMKDEVVALFDTDGNGKGEYWPGAPGWNSTNMWEIKFRSYGLDAKWEPFVVDDAIFKAQLDSRYKKKEAILFYYWTPEWIHAAYDITQIEEPPRTEGCMEIYQPKEREDWLEASTFNCAHEDAEVWVAFSKSLYERNPKAANFLKNITLDPDTVNEWILKVGKEKLDPQDVAEEWVDSNKEIVDKWLGES